MPDLQRPARGRKSSPRSAAVEPPAPIETEPEVSISTPIELGSPPPRDVRDIDFFAYLARLTPGDWDDRIVYLYRQDKGITKADPASGKFIAKIPHAFDEEHVAERFGGGRFLAIVKNQRSNEAERKHSFEIEGAPILQPDEVRKLPAGGSANAPAGLEQTVSNMLDRMMNMLQELRKNPDADEDAVTRVAQTMQRGTEAIIDVMQKAMTSRVDNGGSNATTEKLIDLALRRLENPASAAADPMHTISSTLDLLKGLGLVNQPRTSLKEMLGELKDVLGVDAGTLLGGGSGATDWKGALVAMAPQVLAVGRELLQTWRTASDRQLQIAVLQAQQMQQAGIAAAPPAAAPVNMTSPTATPAAPSLPPQFAPPAPGGGSGRAADGSVDFDWVRRFVVRHFQNGRSGEFVAEMLKEMFADQVPLFAAAFGNAQELLDFSKADPVLSAIAGEAEFPEFVQEFSQAMQPEPTAEPSPA